MTHYPSLEASLVRTSASRGGQTKNPYGAASKHMQGTGNRRRTWPSFGRIQHRFDAAEAYSNPVIMPLGKVEKRFCHVSLLTHLAPLFAPCEQAEKD